MAEVPQKMIFAAVAAMLLPMAGYSYYLAWDAWHEGERLVDARELPEEGSRTDSRFYRLAGLAAGTWLNPPEIPEVKDALQFKVYKERQKPDQTWKEVPHDYPRVSRVTELKVKGVPVKLSKYATVVMDETTATRDLGGGDRLVIGQHPGHGQDLVVYGYYAARAETGAQKELGALTDGTLGRLLIVHPAREAEMIQVHEKAGRTKAAVLGGAGLLVMLLMAYALRRALR